jgi:hypothetical protein
VCVLQEKLVDVFSWVVGGGTLSDGVLTVLLGVHVGRAAGEENCLAGVDQVGNLDGCSVQGNFDGHAATAFDTGGVLRPGALVIVRVGRGRERNGNARAKMRRRVHQAKYRAGAGQLEDGIREIGIGFVTVGWLPERKFGAYASEGIDLGLVVDAKGMSCCVPCSFQGAEGNAETLSIVGREYKNRVRHQLFLSCNVGVGTWGCRWDRPPFAKERIGCGGCRADAREGLFRIVGRVEVERVALDVMVSRVLLMVDETMAPICMVRVPSGRKSHQEPTPVREGCSATQWPTGVSAGEFGAGGLSGGEL